MAPDQEPPMLLVRRPSGGRRGPRGRTRDDGAPKGAVVRAQLGGGSRPRSSRNQVAGTGSGTLYNSTFRPVLPRAASQHLPNVKTRTALSGVRRPGHGEGGRGADVRQQALLAPWAAGQAHPAAVEDESEAERPPLPGREQGADLGLGLHRIGLGRSGPGAAPGGPRGCPRAGPGRPKATLRTTLAVLRPTPGRVTSSSISEGTVPP